MSRREVVTKSLLQLFAFIAASGLAAELARGPAHSFSYVATLLAASYRPIWKDGRIIDRILLFILAALVGLSVRHFVGWLADYLFTSGIFDAGGAATVAGYKVVLAALSAYLTTRLNVGAWIDWLVAKWKAGSSSRLALVLTALLAPYPGLFFAAMFWAGFDIEVEVFVILIEVAVTGAVFPFAHKAINWLVELPLFGLQGDRAEGPRRLGLLAGWVIGAPVAILLLSQWADEPILSSPFFGVLGLLVTYVLVHAIFWVIEGFRSKSD